MADTVKIDADQVTDIRLSEDATRVSMTLLGDQGHQVLLSLPASCLNAVVSVVPRQAAPDVVNRLDSWSMGVAENAQDLVLTLRTPEGAAISFALKPWQVEGMATIATYGSAQRSQPKTMH